MKRDMNLIREILLFCEKECVNGGTLDIDASDFPEHSEDTVLGHLRLLDEAGYISGKGATNSSVFVNGITWVGHDFLDSVRDPEIWRNTKTIANKAGGWTFAMLTEIAKSLLNAKIKEITGMEALS